MVNLSVLSLLRNDPKVAAEMLAAAEKGDVDAQYGMGLIYAEGRGVVPDLVSSYYWLCRAIAQGDAGAKTLLRVVAIPMSQQQVEEARQLLDEYDSVDRSTVTGTSCKRKVRANRTGRH